jgi:hypothetical protein
MVHQEREHVTIASGRMRGMSGSAEPGSVDPMLDVLVLAPIGEPWTPEQRAELDRAVTEVEAGRARLVRHDDVPDALEEIHRGEHGG